LKRTLHKARSGLLGRRLEGGAEETIAQGDERIQVHGHPALQPGTQQQVVPEIDRSRNRSTIVSSIGLP
jgi:hypothetical protein